MAEFIPRLNNKGIFTQLDAGGNFVGRTADRGVAEGSKSNIPVARVLLFRNTFRGKEVLLQRRGDKPLWPGLLDASVVETAQMNAQDPWEPEHPRDTAERGLREELGIETIVFDSKSHNDTWEGEDYPMQSFITTYTALYNGPFSPSDEVAEVEWIRVRKLKKEVKTNPDKFTPSLVEFVTNHL